MSYKERLAFPSNDLVCYRFLRDIELVCDEVLLGPLKLLSRFLHILQIWDLTMKARNIKTPCNEVNVINKYHSHGWFNHAARNPVIQTKPRRTNICERKGSRSNDKNRLIRSCKFKITNFLKF